MASATLKRITFSGDDAHVWIRLPLGGSDDLLEVKEIDGTGHAALRPSGKHWGSTCYTLELGRGGNLSSLYHGAFRFFIGQREIPVTAKPLLKKSLTACGYKHVFSTAEDGRLELRITTAWARGERKAEERDRNAVEAYAEFRKLPIDEHKIFFESMSTRYYNDNPRAIYEELRDRGGNWKLVWGLKNCKTDIGNGGIVAMYNSLDYWRHIATSKYIVSNINQFQLVKRPEQVVINTMHGIPLKHMGLDAAKSAATREKMIRVFTQDWDIFVSPCDYMTDIIRSESYGFKGRVLEFGYPRADILVNNANNNQLRQTVRDMLGVPDGKKLILYAPTFRSKKKLDIPLDFAALKEALGSDYCIAFRSHYLLKKFIDPAIYNDFILDGNVVENTNDLLIGTDVLITDYSSIMFDFSLFKRPMFFYIPDWERYMKRRGMYFDLQGEYPELCATTIDGLLALFEEANQSKSALDRFSKRFNQYETGHAAKDVVDEIWGEIS